MKYIRKIPGWFIILTIFGVLYSKGLHTQIIGQAQRLILATGVMNPKGPFSSASEEGDTALTTADMNHNLA